MTYKVPALSIVLIVIVMLIGIAIPVGLYWYFRKRRQCDCKPFWIGCGVMFLFAFVLEQIVHAIVLGSPIGDRIQGNLWLYGLYGGLMAGLFEETGRFLAFRTVLRGNLDRNSNALMYGAGHGGFEAFYLLTIGMLNNLIYAVLLNTGHAQILTDSLSGESLTALEAAFAALASTPSWMFLVSVLERGGAVIAQLALSVLVWTAVKKRDCLWMYPLAILLHLLLDLTAVVVNGFGVPVLLVEGVIWLMALLMAALAAWTWKRKLVLE